MCSEHRGNRHCAHRDAVIDTWFGGVRPEVVEMDKPSLDGSVDILENDDLDGDDITRKDIPPPISYRDYKEHDNKDDEKAFDEYDHFYLGDVPRNPVFR